MEEILIEDMMPPLAAAVETSGNILEHINASIPWDIIFVAYIFVFFDMFYGILVSIVKGEAQSRKLLKGLHNKIFILFIPIIGILLKAFFVLCSLPNDWQGTETINGWFGVSHLSDFPICFLLCAVVILMEFISFLENSAKLDPRARHFLKFLKKNVNDKNEVKDLVVDDNDVKLAN